MIGGLVGLENLNLINIGPFNLINETRFTDQMSKIENKTGPLY